MEERLQKIIARGGISSRRTAEKMITDGRVSVNNVIVNHLGAKADPHRDDIRVDGRLISCEQTFVYIALHKPRGYVTTLNDPQQRPIVTDLLAGINERVYPVGRLDYDSEGLLIMTNDGDFAHKMQHPRFGIPKTYRVKVSGRFTSRQARNFEEGIVLTDGRFKPLTICIEKYNEKSTWLMLTIMEGRNRIIRRAFEDQGHSVVRLIRLAMTSVDIKGLAEGTYRHLSSKEVRELLAAASRKQPESGNIIE